MKNSQKNSTCKISFYLINILHLMKFENKNNSTLLINEESKRKYRPKIDVNMQVLVNSLNYN